ncbi:acid phosphatase 1-like isoform X2 [Lycium ferocissimum]|uniref:acid phosphatase 1-like isoform X2 n=1 Tax=Lycium ferocissimum TaxID=112874 RepID=UPI0028150A82|nr:acid phosphatase 1-like isoform X2 [Lycium ferocissimum]
MKIILFLLLIIATGAAAAAPDQVNCLSWHLAVETDNIRDWETVPPQCKSYVSAYMTGQQYRDDCNVVVNTAIEYAKTLNVSKEGKDLWVFNVDEVTLSNVPYFSRPTVGFGARKSNVGKKYESWIKEGKSPAVPGVLNLYKTLLDLGIKPIFITDTEEEFRQVRMTNLKKAGYNSWFKFICKGKNDTYSRGYSEYYDTNWKSKKRAALVKSGYRLVGNLGGWWDIYGDFLLRTFKMPNPMYYF